MSKIIDELKKISNENNFDLDKFESVYDLIAELEEKNATNEKNYKKLEKEKNDISQQFDEIKKEKDTLIETNEKAKKEILDLKEKYIDRFNESPLKNNEKNNHNENITINDLFKEV